METILSVRSIDKTFDRVKAVKGISFDVRKGKITGLLGRNGAGKTTTIRMITGIFMPDAGEIVWHGGGDRSDFRNRIGYLPEERGLYKQMKIVEHLLFLAEIKGSDPRLLRSEAEKWLERFELLDKREAKIEELSKGNQQKVQLIGTLLHDPELIILDEPMSGLDPVNVVLVRRLLTELKQEGKTILLSTHMMAEAEKLADDIILVHQGEVVLAGALEAVKRATGRNNLQLAFDGDASFLATFPGVVRADVHTHTAELELDNGVDPQKLLEASVGRLRLRKFEVGVPSLEQIFIEKVGAESLGPVDPEEVLSVVEVAS